MDLNGAFDRFICLFCTEPSSGMDGRTVTLFPSIDYITSSDVFDALGVCMHSALKVLLCIPCRVALTSGMVVGHKKKHHHMHEVHSRFFLI